MNVLSKTNNSERKNDSTKIAHDLTKSLTLHEANKIKLYHNERIFTLPSDSSKLSKNVF